MPKMLTRPLNYSKRHVVSLHMSFDTSSFQLRSKDRVSFRKALEITARVILMQSLQILNGDLAEYVKISFPEHELSLVRFRRQYYQRLSVNEIAFPPAQILACYEAQQWIWNFVQQAQILSPNTTHDQTFLKRLLLQIEKAVQNFENDQVCF